MREAQQKANAAKATAKKLEEKAKRNAKKAAQKAQLQAKQQAKDKNAAAKRQVLAADATTKLEAALRSIKKTIGAAQTSGISDAAVDILKEGLSELTIINDQCMEVVGNEDAALPEGFEKPKWLNDKLNATKKAEGFVQFLMK